MEKEHPHEEHVHKKGRHRKKQLYNSILQQMEFYFGNSNLTKDRFLSQLIQTDPYVDINIFLQFNKIRKLTNNIEDIAKAISKSELIELSEDRTKIRRKIPVEPKENVDECTVYVERLKSDATHEWLTSIFSEFGTVVYVSIPKYRHNGMPKGFAFVEFENEEGAKNTLDYFESINCKIPAMIEPEKLCSVASYKVYAEKELERPDKEEITSGKKNKRKLSESDNEAKQTKTDQGNEANGKKRKLSESEMENNTKKIKLEVNKTNEVEEVGGNTSEGENEEKKKKKHKKAHKKKCQLKEIGLQILSKKDWKRMRNRYLEMQRKTMKQLKNHLNTRNRYENNATVSAVTLTQNENAEQKEKRDKDFAPGIIVKIALSEPCDNNKKLKTEIKAFSTDIKYVDIPLQMGSEEIYLRFSDNKHAELFATTNFDKGKPAILEGDEEKQYWEKIEKAREKKDKQGATKQQRGRDKLLKKAEQAAKKHIRFDDAE